MTVNPSAAAGFAAQLLDNNGVILSGGKIYTYAAGTTTPQATYTDLLGITAHANPIILDSAGRVPGGEIWLTGGASYKFLIETSTGILLNTYDNIFGINDLSFVTGTVSSTNVSFLQAGIGAVTRTAQSKMRDAVSANDFGAVGDGVADDTTAIQTAINYCVANQKDLLIPGLSFISASLNIDRLVDSANADNYFTIASDSGGGIVVSSAIPIFSTTLVNPGNPNFPVSQMVRFNGLKFESTNNALAAYVLDQNKFLRVLFESCNFRKIKCLFAPVNKLTQTITFQNCQARRWTGTFFKSDEITFDLKVLGGLWEAGGDAFDISYPVGTAFIGANIEGMETFAIKYIGGYGLDVHGCYFEQNGDVPANGCSIDGSAGLGGGGSENVLISGNMFSGDTDTPAKPQVKWGDCTTATSIANQCTTTLHQFGTNSRVNIIGDYARTAVSTNDTTLHNGIRNDLQIGTVYRAEGNYRWGGIIRSSFVNFFGGFLRLRSLQDGTESTTGIDIDNNGDTSITGNGLFSKYLDISEIIPPSPPANNTGRLFVRDTGGKSQLAIQFPTGIVQIIATEP